MFNDTHTRRRRLGSDVLLKFGPLDKLSESDLIQTTLFPHAAVTKLCQLIADDLVRSTDHVTYANQPLDAKNKSEKLKKNLRNS